MFRLNYLLCLIAIWVVAGVQTAHAQAYGTRFVTSITYQNVGDESTTVRFELFRESSSTPLVTSRTLNAGASSSVFVGSITRPEGTPVEDLRAVRISADQPLVATAVQIAQPATGPVRNRPLSNAVGFGGSEVYVASLLKNRFDSTTILAIQNVEPGDDIIDVTLHIYDADSPSSPARVLSVPNIPAGNAVHLAAGAATGPLGEILPPSFNGSVVVTAVKDDSELPGVVAATALELQITGLGAVAFEGVPTPASTIYMATALCDVFGGQTTFYAVQNTDRLNSTNVTVRYSNGVSHSQAVAPGAKVSFNTCAAAGMTPGFSGAATITSSHANIIVIGKVSGAGRLTAFVGETAGSNRVYLPYVRWTSDDNYNSGRNQRTFIAIQNIATTAVSNVRVRYLDKDGVEVGVHTIASIAAGGKANSKAVDAAGDTARLVEFGHPEGNSGGGFGGGVIIEAPSGAQLISLARVTSKVADGEVAEDYNGLVTGSGTLYLPLIR